MTRRTPLIVVFAALALVAWAQNDLLSANLQVTVGRIQAQQRALPPETGVFPREWVHGASCGSEPDLQVHAYNEDLYILRQSKCAIFEAPFLYLIFGEDRALLMDTGATPSVDVRSVVDQIIADWLVAKGRDAIPLTVAHTHGHFDHIAGDNQFDGDPLVDEFVPAGFGQAIPWWGFVDYPKDVPTIDLGGRVLDVLGTPGHHPASVTLYDRNTQLLLTGDIVYPGHLFVFSQNDWPRFVDSMQRLVTWASEHPVQWVLGCHVETGEAPFSSFPYGALVHPDEHVLQFPPSILAEIFFAARTFDGDPECTIFEEFVIHPVYKCGIAWNG